jgi:hypothetical protein
MNVLTKRVGVDDTETNKADVAMLVYQMACKGWRINQDDDVFIHRCLKIVQDH